MINIINIFKYQKSYIMITLNHTSKSYTDRTLRSDFHYTITSWSKIALIWPNWCGKSTMLACITGRDTVDEWLLTTKGLVAHIEQEISDKYLNFTIEEYRYQHLPSHDDIYLWYIAMDEWWLEFDLTTQLKSLSWWQRKIIQLMTLSFNNYDIIILDEPTNHLDMSTKIKLSDYLISTKSIVVCVTHDRWFINQRAIQVRAFDHGRVKTYPGNYDDYQVLLEQAQIAQQRAHDSVAKELDRQAQVLAEFKRRSKISSDPARGKMIRTRSKIIERMQDRQQDKVIIDKHISLTATPHTRSSKELIKIKHHDVTIAGRTLISDINLTIHSGDKIALIWPNWCGKSTFVKDLLPLLSGTSVLEWVEGWGEGEAWSHKSKDSKTLHNSTTLLSYKYIDQLNSTISWEQSVLDRYIAHCPGHMPDPVAINQLLQAGFTHWQMKQSVNSSSYGQKLKLTILTSIKSAVDLLILDEPTNHLDIVTIQALERMIHEYGSSVLLISHDPYFIEQSGINIIYHIHDCKMTHEQI